MAMTYRLFLLALIFKCIYPIKSSLAHFGLSGDDDVGHALFWFYGILLVGIIGTVIYRKWIAKNETPERRQLKQNLREFESSLNSFLVQLQNADDYPNECGISEEQRLEKNESVATIQNKIDEIRLELATT